MLTVSVQKSGALENPVKVAIATIKPAFRFKQAMRLVVGSSGECFRLLCSFCVGLFLISFSFFLPPCSKKKASAPAVSGTESASGQEVSSGSFTRQ